MSKEVIESSGNTIKGVPGGKHAGSAISGIRDNYLRGAVGEFLLEKIREGSDLSVVSAYFTIYAFGALQKRLVEIDRMRFLFGEPRFLQSLDPERTDKKAFKIEDEGLQLANRLQQKRLARDNCKWGINLTKSLRYSTGRLWQRVTGRFFNDLSASRVRRGTSGGSISE